MKLQTFNDLLALILVVGILGIWTLALVMYPDLRPGIIGALGPILTLVVQFYFRRREPTEGEG